jgi:hypothetical protein
LERKLRHSPECHFPEHFITYTLNFGARVFEDIFLYQGPFDVVAHFASLKYLANEEDILSIETLIENNVFRTHKLLGLLVESPPKHFFCVSQEKPANPVNISGATAMLAEEMIMAYSVLLPVKTYTPDICQTEEEAKEKAQGRGGEWKNGRPGLFIFGVQISIVKNPSRSSLPKMKYWTTTPLSIWE